MQHNFYRRLKSFNVKIYNTLLAKKDHWGKGHLESSELDFTESMKPLPLNVYRLAEDMPKKSSFHESKIDVFVLCIGYVISLCKH